MKMVEQLANNQVIMEDGNKLIFQSYKSVIAIKEGDKVTFSKHWDYSKTTMKYLGQFLNSNAKEIREKFKAEIYTVGIDVDGNLLKEVA